VLQIDHLPEGTQLRLARVAAGLTLFDVSKLADVSPPRLSEFERGRPSLSPEAVERVRSALASLPNSDPARETASAVA
jgi:transcriptional regulator with XRE-family HTH domain